MTICITYEKPTFARRGHNGVDLKVFSIALLCLSLTLHAHATEVQTFCEKFEPRLSSSWQMARFLEQKLQNHKAAIKISIETRSCTTPFILWKKNAVTSAPCSGDFGLNVRLTYSASDIKFHPIRPQLGHGFTHVLKIDRKESRTFSKFHGLGQGIDGYVQDFDFRKEFWFEVGISDGTGPYESYPAFALWVTLPFEVCITPTSSLSKPPR